MIFDPNPLFFEMVRIFKENYSPENKVVICNEGSTRCFDGSTMIHTISGPKRISDIKRGEMVLTLNEKTQKKEYKPVFSLLTMKNEKPTDRLKLKSGKEIICTEDHEFYYEGAWHSLKYLLSLQEKANGKD